MVRAYSYKRWDDKMDLVMIQELMDSRFPRAAWYLENIMSDLAFVAYSLTM